MKPMLNQRQRQVARSLQRAMGEILAENGRAWFGNKIVSLTQVYVTTDLGLARFYLGMSMIKEADELIKEFNAQSKGIKKILAAKIKNQFRRCPDIVFFKDDTLDEQIRLDEIFDEMKKKDE
tara:strand:- start:496 stop:861 length:366 start_codon:yes stop_codon:yes gene_type:complete